MTRRETGGYQPTKPPMHMNPPTVLPEQIARPDAAPRTGWDEARDILRELLGGPIEFRRTR